MGGGAVLLAGFALVEGVQVLNLLMVMFFTGSFHLKILELGQPKLKYLFVISLLKSAVPVELLSCSLGKVWKLSPPRDLKLMRQLAVPCACPPLVLHYN